MKLIKRISIGVLLALTIIISTTYILLNKELPDGVSGIEADNFAKKILQTIEHQKYLDTQYIQWSFRNKHHYKWNKKAQSATVRWDDYLVTLDLKAPLSNSIVQQPSPLSPEERNKLINKALSFFNNDSFWIVAPHKLFDHGTSRKLVTLKNQKKALLITYNTGGTTPGDAYLWHVDDNYRPTRYQMWVSIIPIGGLEASWDSWKQTESGTFLSQKHQLLGLEIPISNLRAWND